MSTRVPPEHQPPENLTTDENGRQVQLGTDPTAGVIASNPDGSETLRSPSATATYQDPIGAVQPGRDVSSRWVMRVAVKNLLETMVCYQVDGAARLADAPAGVRPFELKRIFLSWPRPQDEADPSPTVMIRVQGPIGYSDRQRTPTYLEGTLGRWAPNTVIRKVARATGQVQVIAWCAGPEEEEAVESAIERTILVEPHEDLVGRRVVVPQYYDQQARVGLVDIDEAIDETLVREGRWPLVATVQVEIDRVILVRAPPSMQTVIGQDVGPQVTINV